MPRPPHLKALSLLARLARTELDRSSQELRTLTHEAMQRAEEKRALERALPRELAAALSLPGGPASSGAWFSAALERAYALACTLGELEHRRAALEAEVREHHLAARRYELVIERMRTDLARKYAEAERKTLDERATLRAAHLRTRGQA